MLLLVDLPFSFAIYLEKGGTIMKTILTFILALVPCIAFAGDFIFAPVISKPPSEGNGLDSVDTYVISGDNGSKVVHVMSLDPVAKDSYLVVGPDGESNVVIKFD